MPPEPPAIPDDPNATDAMSPVALKRTKLGHRVDVAAGLKAVEEVAEYGLTESGLGVTVRSAYRLNQTHGFDCQSCAWPNPDRERSIAEFCENGFKAVTYEATSKLVDRKFFAAHSVADLQQRTDYWLGLQGRLAEPMVLRPGGTHYEPISWDDAFALLGRELKAVRDPNEAVFYTSGRTSNETAFLYQLFCRAYGTNNLPDCSNMCHESTSVALPPMIGIGKACVKLSDFEETELIFLIGQNPGTNHPRMLTALQHAKEKGARIISVNPMPETGLFRFKNPQDLMNPLHFPRFFLTRGTRLSDLWLPVRINGDMAFLQGLMKCLLAAEDAQPGTVFDHDFIRHYTEGYEALIAQLRQVTWPQIEEYSGLRQAQIEEAAALVRGAKRIIVCWCMGLTQHENGVATIQDVINFLLLGGHIGRPGSGPCPVRGHSNVQGDRTMGIWDKPKPEFLERLAREFSIQPPKEHGFDVVESIKAMHEGRVRVLFAMGGNLLSAPGDTRYVAEGVRKCDLSAYVSIKLNRAHLVTGRTALILPCLGRTEVDRQASGEQFMTVEDTMGVVSPTRGHLKPASPHLKSEPAIVAGLAKATLGSTRPINWDAYIANYDLIRDKIEAVIPGFPAFNARIREGTFYLPNPPRDERKFDTPSRKAVFMPHPLTRASAPPGFYLMTTVRSHDQFNTSIYGLDDRYRGVYNGRRVIFMNEEDMREAKLMQGQLVDLTSHYRGEERRVEKFMVAPHSLPRGCTATYYPEANPLVPISSVAEKSNTPTSKSVVIRITPSADQTHFGAGDA